MYNHTINTTLGKFHFGWANSNSKWIAGKFEEPAKAKEIYTCNPYSGKYNFHGTQDTPLNELMNFLHDLKKSGRLITNEELEKIYFSRNNAQGYILGIDLTPFVTDKELLQIVQLKDELAYLHNLAVDRKNFAA